ncbi:MAG TPA: hypothetical protein VJG29_01445 [Candidatus Paceibacterota bacterium]
MRGWRKAQVSFLKLVITTLLVEQKRVRKDPEAHTYPSHKRIEARCFAVHMLLERFNPPKEVVNHAIRLALALYQGGDKMDKFLGTRRGFLTAAGEYLAYGASRPIVEKVILEMARAGWHWHLPEMTWRYLKRALSPKEVRLLVKKFVEGGGLEKSTTDTLTKYICSCIPDKKEQHRLCATLEEAARKYHNWID